MYLFYLNFVILQASLPQCDQIFAAQKNALEELIL